MDAPEVQVVLTDAASPVGRQERHFYFFLFLLSRKARNAITKLPKDISKPIIPININMISAAVITTHLPSYVLQLPGISSGGYHPVMGTHMRVSTHI